MGRAGITHLRWSMRRLEYGLFILGVLGTLASGLIYAPLARLIPGMLPTALPLLLTLGSLSVLLVRLYGLEHTVAQTQEHRETLQAQLHAVSARLDAVTAEAHQLTAALHGLQQIVAQNEWLWPGKLLLSQRRYDDA